MKEISSKWGVALLLPFIAGYCDIITLSACGFFTTHIGGNMIWLSYLIANKGWAAVWPQMLSVPVYLFSLLLGRQLVMRSAGITQIIKWAGAGLIMVGLSAVMLTAANTGLGQGLAVAQGLAIVALLALVQATGLRCVRYGQMVTDTGMVAISYLLSADKTLKQKVSGMSFLTFAAGCVAGALVGSYVGLSGIMLPGVLLVVLVVNE